MIRAQIAHLIERIEPYDAAEESARLEALEWISRGDEIFRIEKPDRPAKHLVCYFPLVDRGSSQLLLVQHRNSGLWLPPGGHVEYDEHPFDTVLRECREELGFSPTLMNPNPVFLSSGRTVGSTAGHTDVALWYLIDYLQEPLHFDATEFEGYDWFPVEEPFPAQTEPNLARFIAKVERERPRWLRRPVAAASPAA